MKVLFAVDGSVESADAMRGALRFLNRNDTQADVVCVAPEYLPAMTGWDEGRLRDRYRHRILTETQRILTEAKELLQSLGMEARTLPETGPPGGMIVRLASDYDVVVVGSSSERDVRHCGLGPVASHVAHHAPCSVVVGRRTAGSAGTNGFRVLVPLDGSTASLRAVDTLASLVNWQDAEVTLLHVLETPWLHLGLEQDWFGFDEAELPEDDSAVPWQRFLREQAERLLERGRDRLREHHPSVERKIAEGIPGNEILGEAEQGNYDLVVVGATGASDLKHQLLGSVSSRLAWHAPCSVLIVRSKE